MQLHSVPGCLNCGSNLFPIDPVCILLITHGKIKIFATTTIFDMSGPLLAVHYYLLFESSPQSVYITIQVVSNLTNILLVS